MSHQLMSISRWLWLHSMLFCVVAASGCATFSPLPLEEVPFRKRAETRYEGNVRVTVAVLSAQESETVFGVPLYKKGIQPVWLEVENNDEKPVWFSPIGLDPDYFSPYEVAYMHHCGFSKAAKFEMDKHFDEQAMGSYIGPESVRSGFVFTHLDLGTKGFNIDLVGEDHEIRTLTFFINVPGLRADHQTVDWHRLYAEDEIVSYDEAGLRKALEGLPGCTTNYEGTKEGEPLNLVIIARGQDLHQALIRGGWDESGAMDTAFQAASGIQGQYTPMSLLYLYGRAQDAAFRQTRPGAGERNQLRLWLSPMTVEGKPVWVGQIRRVLRRSKSQEFRLEPDLDEARRYIVQNLWYKQALSKYAYVKGVEAATWSKPRQNIDGDRYFTDGYRLVLWVPSEPVSLAEVKYVEWENPPER